MALLTPGITLWGSFSLFCFLLKHKRIIQIWAPALQMRLGQSPVHLHEGSKHVVVETLHCICNVVYRY